MGKKSDMLISVSDDHMSNKRYSPHVSLIGYINGSVDDTQRLVISKKDLRRGLKEITHLTYHKLNVVIDTYVQLGLLIEDGDKYWFNNVGAPFIGLQGETIRFCAKYLGIHNLKVYLYLMNKYQLNCIGKRNGRYTENYFFSKREIAKALGYSGTNEINIQEVNKSLQVLADTGLIEYSESKRREGHQGYYHELYIVRQYSSSHLKADATYVKESQEQGKALSEASVSNLAKPIRENIKVIKAAEDQKKILEITQKLLK